jgi:hypothetical protein
MFYLASCSKCLYCKNWGFTFFKVCIFECVFLVSSLSLLLCCVHCAPSHSHTDTPPPVTHNNKRLKIISFSDNKQFQLSICSWGLVQHNRSYVHRKTLRHFTVLEENLPLITISFLGVNSNVEQYRPYLDRSINMIVENSCSVSVARSCLVFVL